MKFLLPLLLIVLGSGATATTLYKSVDAQGKVTYSDAPPRDGKGKAQEITIEEERTNTMPSTDLQEQMRQQQNADEASKNRQIVADQDWQRRHDRAQDDLAQAKRNLESAKQVQEGDTVGSAYGGARPNAQWIERLEQAEADVEARQRELNQIKRQR